MQVQLEKKKQIVKPKTVQVSSCSFGVTKQVKS